MPRGFDLRKQLRLEILQASTNFGFRDSVLKCSAHTYVRIEYRGQKHSQTYPILHISWGWFVELHRALGIKP